MLTTDDPRAAASSETPASSAGEMADSWSPRAGQMQFDPTRRAQNRRFDRHAAVRKPE
jgi:hypothetical protein